MTMRCQTWQFRRTLSNNHNKHETGRIVTSNTNGLYINQSICSKVTCRCRIRWPLHCCRYDMTGSTEGFMQWFSRAIAVCNLTIMWQHINCATNVPRVSTLTCKAGSVPQSEVRPITAAKQGYQRFSSSRDATATISSRTTTLSSSSGTPTRC